MLWEEISVKEQSHYWEICLSMGIVPPSPIEGAFCIGDLFYERGDARIIIPILQQGHIRNVSLNLSMRISNNERGLESMLKGVFVSCWHNCIRLVFPPEAKSP